MALTVGELVGFLSLDTRGLDTGVDRAEREMRSLADDATDAGDRAGRGLADGLGEGATRAERQLADLHTALVRDADRTGDSAGDALAEGLADGAADGVDRAEREVDGLRSDLTTEARQAGDQAGEALGDGLAEGGEQGAQDAAGQVEAGQGRLAAAGAAIGAAGGAALIAAFTEAMDESRITGKLGAQLGATAEEAQRYGDIAGDLYTQAITEDFQGAADAIQATMRSGLMPPTATNAQIESMSTRLADLATLMDEDVSQAARTAAQMVKTGLARDGAEAIDILVAGTQRGANAAEDLLDTFSEYSTQFRSMGLTGEQAMGLIQQGLKGGARDADVVADTIKEFSIEAVAGGERVRGGFKSLGLDADEMVDKFAKGGKGARDALDEVFDRLRKIEDPAKRNAVAIELFGTKAEDMAGALDAMDPSEAVEALGEVGGAAEKAGNTLRDNAGTRVEQFKRSLTQGFVEAAGTAIGGLEELSGRLRGFWDEAGEGAGGLPDQILNALGGLGEKLWEKLQELGPTLIDAILQAGQDLADYITENPEEVFQVAVMGAAFVAAVAALPIVAGAALISAATAAIWIFVGGLVSGLIEKIPEWWTAFGEWISEKADQAGEVLDVLGGAISRWFGGLWEEYISGPVSRTWDSWMDTVDALPGRTYAALGELGSKLKRRASDAWQDFKDAASRKAREITLWAGGLPGRISRAIGGLGSLLYGKGQSVVSGLWAGIRSMGGWLRDTLYNWARSVIPGPIARALGIASPSKLMRDQIGRWIPAGVVEGIEAGQSAVDAAMANLVDPTLARVPAWPETAVHRTGGPGGSAADRPMVIRVAIGDREFGELWVDTARREIRTRPGLKAELTA
ncbi:phage tail tape measure protein [Streptomyces macrosporus]|uniref:Phage tail tape measure protein domain-containing protein n=1 Tax=Streptomyces macrosporus TaxID=44032 RepID=A0ABN3KGQ5_9ACTN